MAINLNALKTVQEDLNKRTSGGGFLYQKDWTEETYFRVLPPSLRLKGVFFIEQIVYWINNKPYISPATFGEDCPIADEISMAEEQAKSDPGLAKLLNSDKLSKQSQFLMPVLHLELPQNSEIFKVIDDKAKIMAVSITPLKDINKIVTNRRYQNGTPDGVLDRVMGYNMIGSKKKKGPNKNDVEYSVLPDSSPYEMDEKYYTKIPDVVAAVRKQAYSDDFLRGVISNFLYGEAMPKEENHLRYPEEKGDTYDYVVESGSSVATEVSTGAAATSGRRGAKNSNAALTVTDIQPEPEKAAATSSRRGGAAANPVPPVTGGRRSTPRNVADDLSNVDE